jgi:hypothetical protein
VYEQAFDQFLGPNAVDPNRTPANEAGDGAAPPEGSEAASGDDTPPPPEPPALTDEQVQLLSRNKVPLERIADWPDDERQEFLTNLAKRERDTTTTFQDLRDRIAQLEQAGGKGGSGTPGDGKGGKSPSGRQPGATPPSALVEQTKQVMTGLTETFGDEIRPLGSLVESICQQLEQAEQRAASVPAMQGLVVEMTLEAGIRDLVGDYPTLSKAEARKQVIERFKADWPGSRQRQGDGPLLERIKAALTDAAKAEFSSTTESAAQVALQNKTKTRLKNQPPTGGGRGRSAPKTSDDVYDQAYQEHLKPELVQP